LKGQGRGWRRKSALFLEMEEKQERRGRRGRRSRKPERIGQLGERMRKGEESE